MWHQIIRIRTVSRRYSKIYGLKHSKRRDKSRVSVSYQRKQEFKYTSAPRIKDFTHGFHECNTRATIMSGRLSTFTLKSKCNEIKCRKSVLRTKRITIKLKETYLFLENRAFGAYFYLSAISHAALLKFKRFDCHLRQKHISVRLVEF